MLFRSDLGLRCVPGGLLFGLELSASAVGDSAAVQFQAGTVVSTYGQPEISDSSAAVPMASSPAQSQSHLPKILKTKWR